MEQLLAVMGQRGQLITMLEPQVGVHMRAALPLMGDGSLFNLMTAMLAANTAGVAGDLIVRIPRKTQDRLEVHWRATPD